MYRRSEDGLRPSCTASYGEIAATLDAGRSQVAAAIKWLKAREWLDVLVAGPRGGVYAVQWPRIEEQLSEAPASSERREMRRPLKVGSAPARPTCPSENDGARLELQPAGAASLRPETPK
jgi:hypothetical protein